MQDGGSALTIEISLEQDRGGCGVPLFPAFRLRESSLPHTPVSFNRGEAFVPGDNLGFGSLSEHANKDLDGAGLSPRHSVHGDRHPHDDAVRLVLLSEVRDGLYPLFDTCDLDRGQWSG